VRREALARTESVRGAPNRALALSKVVIDPGARLPLHHHLGTQVSRVVSGVLTYTVEKGSAVVREGDAESDPRKVRTIEAGQTAELRPGQWLVEQPSDIHRAANNGQQRVVIYLATLLEKGAPPATPVPWKGWGS
jgi:quercetin dioxygenase-like cupin family protein